MVTLNFRFTRPDLRLRASLVEAVRAQPADVLLLGGGVDSSLLAALDPLVPAVTVGLAGQGDDLVHAQQVAEHLGLRWSAIELSRPAALQHLRSLLWLFNSYNLELLNHIPLHVGMKVAVGLGAATVRTGEFADEAFRGYSYLYDCPSRSFSARLGALASRFAPPSQAVARALGLEGCYPYLHPEVVGAAQRLDRSRNVREIESDVAGDQHSQRSDPSTGLRMRPWGKLALRQAAHGILPAEIVWRPKTHLEYGAGTVALEDDLAELVAPEEVDGFQEQGLRFLRSNPRAHAGLYKLYTQMGLAPPPLRRPGDAACRSCGGAVRQQDRYHCPTCGDYTEPPLPAPRQQPAVVGGSEMAGR